MSIFFFFFFLPVGVPCGPRALGGVSKCAHGNRSVCAAVHCTLEKMLK